VIAEAETGDSGPPGAKLAVLARAHLGPRLFRAHRPVGGLSAASRSTTANAFARVVSRVTDPSPPGVGAGRRTRYG
jgi:hypothetical protein